MEFRERLEKWMAQKNITKAELARRSGLSESLIGQLVSGAKPNPTIDTINKLADALEISPAAFFINEEYFVSTIADILLPHLNEEERAFVVAPDSRDFIVLAKNIKSDDMSPEFAESLLKSYQKLSRPPKSKK